MDRVVCKCAKCDAILGSLINLWLQLGKKYITPLTHAQDDDPFPIATSGLVRQGDADTLVGGCQLQDAECAKCRANLGQKCLKSPVNHVLSDGQIIFRITSVILKLAGDLRRKAEPKIQRVLQLKNHASEHQNAPSSQTESVNPEPGAAQNSPAADSPDLMQMQAELDAQRQHINRIGATGMQVVTNFETVMARVDRQMQQLSESIDSIRKDRDEQRNDLGALKSEVVDAKWDCQNNSVVARLDQQLQTTDRVVTELRQALHQSKSETQGLREQLTVAEQALQGAKGDAATLKTQIDETNQAVRESIAASREHVCEVSSLRREVKQLRAELAQERAQPQPAEPSSFSSHELDILASSISKIGNRASQVETLQMDFELFRARLQRLEARAIAPGANTSRTLGVEAHARDDDEAQPVYEGNARRKRALTARDDTQTFDKTPQKRAALSPSDLDSGVSTGCSRASDLYGSSRNTRSSAQRPGLRRTRANAGDYGTTRRESWAGRG
ncbi:hypothetical protein HRG_011615 [Hirsutella rhossiliensis]|uniref:Uncharacterized protein n=1 Tax=Hirsutella rhossiliensis TaxID=111463 RepID=A0A9P8SCB8_9HYPO|nr:uncharacterized protein HRG_11615 [Hirsutella rhossiliensis]KAH0957468.1 hypothetical protein HRG_11615 [Hirsutella rhossiliensis]